jgi:DNA-binding response OmpR family regulator
LRHLQVLVVEDKFLLADDTAKLLTAHGATVLGPVATLGEALVLAESDHIQAAVLDIGLQGEMVYPVVGRLRERGVPVLFTTGYDGTAIPLAYRHLPRWEKPFRWVDLIEALSSHPNRAEGFGLAPTEQIPAL